MFRIPPYCTYLSNSSQKKLIFEANHESHIEKLEEFFNKKRVLQAEMKSIQKLARKSWVLEILIMLTYYLDSSMGFPKVEGTGKHFFGVGLTYQLDLRNLL
jgi:hypothetical protein